jgi:hypothetical protein
MLWFAWSIIMIGWCFGLVRYEDTQGGGLRVKSISVEH